MYLNNFGPFDSSVWGTVSDWALVIVTAYTLYFIVKTFRSQLEVQKSQQHVARIENEKFRINAVPEFSLQIYKSDFSEENGGIISEISIDLHLIKNECLDLKIVPNSVVDKIESIEFIIDKLDYISEGAHRIVILKCSSDKKVFDRYGVNFSLNLFYKDIVKNQYYTSFAIHARYSDIKTTSVGPFRQLN